jgi:hypothetical protein
MTFEIITSSSEAAALLPDYSELPGWVALLYELSPFGVRGWDSGNEPKIGRLIAIGLLGYGIYVWTNYSSPESLARFGTSLKVYLLIMAAVHGVILAWILW